MSTRLQTKLDSLESMDMNALKEMWHKYFKHKPPAYQRVYMVRRLAYHLQAKALGGLPKTIRNKLKRLAEDGQKSMEERYNPTAGTRIMREYKGKKVHVTVLEKGFEYDGQGYQSLTAIATKLTGSRTSGPKFFGLKRGKNDK